MFYKDLKFPKLENRPYYYANIVSTIDGKVKVLSDPSYWPIGSRVDYAVYMELRNFGDAIIQGTNTATIFGQQTIKSLTSKDFLDERKRLGKKSDLKYIVVTNSPTEKLFSSLKNDVGFKTLLITNEKAFKSLKAPNYIEVETCGREKIDLGLLSNLLFKQGIKSVLLEGGPRLLASFLREKLVDEIFLTIAPRIYGGKKSEVLTMVEDYLFGKDEIYCKLLSVNKIDNEVFLRYKFVTSSTA